MPGLPADPGTEQNRLQNLMTQTKLPQGQQPIELEFARQIWKGLPPELGDIHPFVLMRELYDEGKLPEKWKGKKIKKKDFETLLRDPEFLRTIQEEVDSLSGDEDGEDDWDAEDIQTFMEQGVLSEWKGQPILPESIPELLQDSEFLDMLDKLEGNLGGQPTQSTPSTDVKARIQQALAAQQTGGSPPVPAANAPIPTQPAFEDGGIGYQGLQDPSTFGMPDDQEEERKQQELQSNLSGISDINQLNTPSPIDSSEIPVQEPLGELPEEIKVREEALQNVPINDVSRPSAEPRNQGSNFTKSQQDMINMFEEQGQSLSDEQKGVLINFLENGKIVAEQGGDIMPLNRYDAWMQEYQKSQEEYKQNKNVAIWTDFATKINKAFTQYVVAAGAAEAQIAGKMKIDAPRVDTPTTDLAGSLRPPNMKEYIVKADLMNRLKRLQEGKQAKGKDFTLGPDQVRYDASGKIIAKGIKKKIGDKIKPRTFQQSDWVDEKDGQPLVFSSIEGKLLKSGKGGKLEAFDGQARRKIPKVLEDREGRKYRLLQDGSKEYIDESAEGKYHNWSDMTPKQQTYMTNLGKEYRKEMQPVMDFETTLEGLDNFVEKNLDGTIGSIKRQLARTIGSEKGVMTDKDVAAFGGTDKVFTSIAQYAHAKIHGGMNEEIQSNFNAIIEVAKENIARKRGEVDKAYVRPAKFRLGKQAGDVFIHNSLGMKGYEKQTTGPYGSKVTRNGKKYKWNTSKGKYQLVK